MACLSTFFDPLFASLLTGLFTHIADSKPAHPSFFFVAMLFICILVVIKILMLRYTNIQKMKVLCFSYLRSARIRGKAIGPRQFASVALMENLDKLRNHATQFKIKQIDQYDQTEAPQYQKETPLRNHLRHVLWRFNCDQLENRDYAALWLCQNGKQLYGARRLFERLLFSEHMRYFSHTKGLGGRMVLLFPDKLGIDEDTFLNLHQEVEAGDDDQLFYFIPVRDRSQEATDLKNAVEAMIKFIGSPTEYKKVQTDVMNAILEEPGEKEPEAVAS